MEATNAWARKRDEGYAMGATQARNTEAELWGVVWLCRSRELADETAEIATEAMLALAEAMRHIEEAWPAASGEVGGPRFRIESE